MLSRREAREEFSKGADMSGADRIARGILIGGALGVFSVLLGFSESLFASVGVGMIMGALAGLTRSKLDQRSKK
jgi:ABC-type dipeptide/oligopeptide/nickel transport system permease subunit